MTMGPQPDPGGLDSPIRTGTGATLWLTGLPSAGKSTLALAVAKQLTDRSRAVQILDGDEIRAQLTRDLGFSRQDRDENVRRIGWLARMLAGHGVFVLAPVIAPYAGARKQVRSLHEKAGTAYIEIYVATSLEVCAARDVKGLYAAQARGEMSGLTGVDDPYEAPEKPDLVFDLADLPAATAAEAVTAHLATRGLLAPSPR